ncbi:hypothetical protein [Pseudomonas phage vB_PaeM_PAO1_Ab06]|uniref:Uncharacterized protein n=1 Tax=Pseudomonas phage vB_PaeM_PAO1_Ab06 TaxID=1548910 RepID=A0A0C7THK5_9CAUD|nr:hypothetical protein [Pseudomonas phage vB_PaeM_PAO1_Ab06]
MKNRPITLILEQDMVQGMKVFCQRQFTGDKNYLKDAMYSFLKEKAGQYDDWTLQGHPSTFQLRTELVTSLVNNGV